MQVSFRPDCELLFRADDAGQLSAVGIQWTRQWSTEDLNRVDECLVLWCFASCNFRCLVPANVAAAFACIILRFWGQVSSVLRGPAVRTLCSCWNHEDCWTTSHDLWSTFWRSDAICIKQGKAKQKRFLDKGAGRSLYAIYNFPVCYDAVIHTVSVSLDRRIAVLIHYVCKMSLLQSPRPTPGKNNFCIWIAYE